MHDIEPETGDIDCQKRRPGKIRRKHQKGAAVYYSPVDEESGKTAVKAEWQPLFFQKTPFDKNTRQKADDPQTEHLPRCPRPLPEKKIGDKTCNRADQKTCFRPTAYAGDDHNGHHRLKLRQHKKCRPPCNGYSCQHGHNEQFTRFGPAPFKYQRKGKHAVKHDQQADKIVLPIAETKHAKKYRPGNNQGQQRRCDKRAPARAPSV